MLSGIGGMGGNMVGSMDQMGQVGGDAARVKKMMEELMASLGGPQGGSGAGGAEGGSEGGGSGADPQAQAQGPQIQMPEPSQGAVNFG